MFILGSITKLFSFIFIVLAYKFYKLPSSKTIVEPTTRNTTENNINGNLYDMEDKTTIENSEVIKKETPLSV